MIDSRVLIVLVATFGAGLAYFINADICRQEGVNPLDDYLPHETNCTQFYKCDHGIPIIFDCPQGLDFSPSKKLCDWPQDAGCRNKTLVNGNTTALCENTGLPECPEHDPAGLAVHLPHPSDCGKFYECDWGVPYLLSCPGGLHFNAQLQVCDWPEAANCPCANSTEIFPAKK